MARLLFMQACIVLALVPAVSAAHHNSGAVFDLDAEVTVKGVVTRYQFRNPHIYFYVLTEQGEEWRIEGGPTAFMKRFGWSRDTLAEGDQIELVGNPSRREGRNSALLKSASVDGTPLPASRGEEAFKQLFENNDNRNVNAISLAGTWTTQIGEDAGWIDDPTSLALTAAARESIENFDEKTMSPVLDCTPMTAPATMMIPDTKKIEILDDVVRIGSEFNGVTRIAYLSGSPDEAPSLQGHSVATLRDNTLTIDTTGFLAHRMGIANGLASSSEKTLHEEFVLDEDGKGLTYSFRLTDPVYLEAPFESQAYWAYRPDLDFEALPCDLENSRRFLDE